MKKLLHIFHAVKNIYIAVIGIHFTICKVQSDNSNPGKRKTLGHSSLLIFSIYIYKSQIQFSIDIIINVLV